MKGLLKIAAVMFFAVCLAQTAGAATVGYTLDDLGSGSWRYNYTIANDDSSSYVGFLDIFFDYGLYDNLTLAVDPWQEEEPGAGLWGDSWYVMWSSPNQTEGMDGSLALISFDDTGIAPGDALTGLSVNFDWLGNGTPGDQSFLFYDSDFNETSGSTYSTDVPEVPEPQTFMLLGTGILAAAAYCRRFRACKAGKRQNG